MKKIPKILSLVFAAPIIIWTIFLSQGFTQDIGTSSGGLQPPPIDIAFTLENSPQAGQEAVLKLKVIPFEDMHADISCLLPEGIEPVREAGVMVRPYEEKHWRNRQQQPSHIEVVQLWVGPLTAGTTKEFVFRVKVPDKERYELIARVEALAKWGIKEEVLVIEIK